VDTEREIEKGVQIRDRVAGRADSETAGELFEDVIGKRQQEFVLAVEMVVERRLAEVGLVRDALDREPGVAVLPERLVGSTHDRVVCVGRVPTEFGRIAHFERIVGWEGNTLLPGAWTDGPAPPGSSRGTMSVRPAD